MLPVAEIRIKISVKVVQTPSLALNCPSRFALRSWQQRRGDAERHAWLGCGLIISANELGRRTEKVIGLLASLSTTYDIVYESRDAQTLHKECSDRNALRCLVMLFSMGSCGLRAIVIV